jgi:hypothetical protein
VTRFRVNGDGTLDWCGLTGWDLAAVFRAYAAGRLQVSDPRVMDLALDAVGGCMAAWEAQP